MRPPVPSSDRGRLVLVLGGTAVVVLLAVLVWAWLREQPVPGPTAPLDAAGPVLLVPGYGGGTDGVDQLAAALRASGRQAEVVPIGDGTGDIRAYAATVLDRARAAVAAGAPSVDLVGFSMGGLVVRAAATDPDAGGLVRRVATISSPHDGTAAAALGGLLGQCPTACQQMQPGSDLLDSLPGASAADRWLSVWSASDEVIRPADSSVLAGATDVLLQSVCPGDVAHSGMVTSPQVAALVGGFLATGTAPATCPAG
ncbi:MAG: hypothetical protein R2737_11295 [Candidatus Nanopelagicales bacterium]